MDERVSAPGPARVSLLIVDDVAAVRRELALLLPLAGPVTVVGEAANGAEAVQQVVRLHPDVVLMDLEMPVMDGLAACRAARAAAPATAVVILTIHSGAESARAAREAGAAACVAKGTGLSELMAAILRPAEGEEVACQR